MNTSSGANSGWCGLENVSAGCANDLGQPHSPVLAHLKKESLVHDHKYRGATKEGISVKSKISWCNKKMASR
jgi:hypothetical protein